MKSRANLRLIRVPIEPVFERAVPAVDKLVRETGLSYPFACEMVAAVLAQNKEVGKLYATVFNLADSLKKKGYSPSEIEAGIIEAAEHCQAQFVAKGRGEAR